MSDIMKTLSDLIEKEGFGLLRDVAKCEAHLSNALPEHRKERFLLIAALKNRVVADLLGSSQGVEIGSIIQAVTVKLHNNLAIVEDSAIWAVRTSEAATLTLGYDQQPLRAVFCWHGLCCARESTVRSIFRNELVAVPLLIWPHSPVTQSTTHSNVS